MNLYSKTIYILNFQEFFFACYDIAKKSEFLVKKLIKKPGSIQPPPQKKNKVKNILRSYEGK